MFPAAYSGTLVRLCVLLIAATSGIRDDDRSAQWTIRSPRTFSPSAQYAQRSLPSDRSPLIFDDGFRVKTPEDWSRRREEILAYWHGVMGVWPPLIDHPKIEYLKRLVGRNSLSTR